MKYYEVEGKTVDEAVNNFLSEHDIAKDFIEYETLETGSKGFLGFGAKNAVVKIKFNDFEFFKRKARLVLSELLEKMNVEDFSIETKSRHPDIIFNIISPDSKILIGKNAQTLDSMQFILNRMVKWEDSETTLVVDVEDYRDRVIEQLKEKAIKLAKTVRRTGKPIKMSPMVTMVRKEVHIALKQIKGINTVSKGDGHLKEILIVPDRKNNNRRGNRKPRPEGGADKDKQPQKQEQQKAPTGEDK